MSAFLHFQRLLPRRTLSRLTGWATRLEGGPLTRGAIAAFIRAFGVDMADAAAPPAGGYRTFNEFFTRPLAPGARPQPPDPATLTSPADGVVSECGVIREDRLLQAKGIEYRVQDLLGGDAERAARFCDGRFATVYLAPYNYHRVHMPTTGTATALHYIAGDLWSVNDTTARLLPGLFCRNERACVHFDCDGGSFAMVMVGAMNVGSIELVVPATSPFRNRPGEPSAAVGLHELERERLARGAEFGRFNMGSTVILLTSAGLAELLPTLRRGVRLEVGQPLGRVSGVS